MYTPHTVANIEGGRGGMKSTQVQLISLLEAIEKPMRICEARETMSSIKDSSHKMLSDLIYKYQMSVSQNGPYTIMEDRILRKHGGRTESEFIFVGVRENVRDQKSLVGINLTIFEEAAKASQDSLDVFMPTVLREEGARMWFIWNPEQTTDPTYKLLMLNPPTNTIHIHTSYLDNPWLSDTMRQLAEDCKRDFPMKYRHIWLGEANCDVEGAIFEDELGEATDKGRICQVPYNRQKPVHTAWDLGFGDTNAIWFYQAYDNFYNFIDFVEGHERTIASWVTTLQGKMYNYGTDWLPHDGVDAMIHHRLSADKSKSPDMVLRSLGRKVRIAPKLSIKTRVDAARTVFPQCRFDADKCAEGIQQLRRYQWEPGAIKRLPGGGTTQMAPSGRDLHNEASHAGSAFCCAAVGMRQPAEYMPGLARPAQLVAEI